MKIQIGDSASFSKTISEADVYGFAGIVGDFNDVHINEIAAQQSLFGRRIAHGMLVAGLISTVIGMKLPGAGSIYLEQELKFKKPVYLGDTVTAVVRVIEILNSEKGIYKLDTVVKNINEENAVEGYAIVMYRGEENV